MNYLLPLLKTKDQPTIPEFPIPEYKDCFSPKIDDKGFPCYLAWLDEDYKVKFYIGDESYIVNIYHKTDKYNCLAFFSIKHTELNLFESRLIDNANQAKRQFQDKQKGLEIAENMTIRDFFIGMAMSNNILDNPSFIIQKIDDVIACMNGVENKINSNIEQRTNELE